VFSVTGSHDLRGPIARVSRGTVARRQGSLSVVSSPIHSSLQQGTAIPVRRISSPPD
jgi:hypothetical protein